MFIQTESKWYLDLDINHVNKSAVLNTFITRNSVKSLKHKTIGCKLDFNKCQRFPRASGREQHLFHLLWLASELNREHPCLYNTDARFCGSSHREALLAVGGCVRVSLCWTGERGNVSTVGGLILSGLYIGGEEVGG